MSISSQRTKSVNCRWQTLSVINFSAWEGAIFSCLAHVSCSKLTIGVIGQLFVKRFTLCYRTVVLFVCRSVLSLCSLMFVHCDQTVRRIKIKLGMQVGLGPGHIVLDGDPAPPPPKGHNPHTIFGPYLLRPNDCIDQDATGYGARPHPRGLCVRWGPTPKF